MVYPRAEFLGQVQHAVHTAAFEHPRIASKELVAIASKIHKEALLKNEVYLKHHTQELEPNPDLIKRVSLTPVCLTQDLAQLLIRYPLSTSLAGLVAASLLWNYPISSAAFASAAYLIDVILD